MQPSWSCQSCLKTIPASLIPSPWQEWQSEPSAMTLRQHSQMECNTCDDRAEESTPQDTLFGNHRLWSRFEHCGILMYSWVLTLTDSPRLGLYITICTLILWSVLDTSMLLESPCHIVSQAKDLLGPTWSNSNMLWMSGTKTAGSLSVRACGSECCNLHSRATNCNGIKPKGRTGPCSYSTPTHRNVLCFSSEAETTQSPRRVCGLFRGRKWNDLQSQNLPSRTMSRNGTMSLPLLWFIWFIWFISVKKSLSVYWPNNSSCEPLVTWAWAVAPRLATPASHAARTCKSASAVDSPVSKSTTLATDRRGLAA